MYYFLTVLITVIVMWIFRDLAFKCYIEKMSKEQKPTLAFGKNYFFMTQDQVQNACKSIIKSFPETLKDEI